MPDTRKHEGVIVPMVTPFTAEGEIDRESTCHIIDHLAAGGVDGVFVLGTTGEAASIAANEKIKLVKTAADYLKNRAILYAGISGNCFHESVTAAKCFMDLGCDVLVAHAPCYYPLQEDEIFRYFMHLADAVAGPLMLYHIPKTTGLSLSIDIADKLSRHENIIGLKDSENTPGRLEAAAKRFFGRPDFSYVVGCAPLSAKAVGMGAAGIVPSSANIQPQLYRSLYENARDDNLPAANTFQEQTDQISAVYQKHRSLGQSLAALKAAMHCLGFCQPTVLPPLETLENAEIAGIKKQLTAVLMTLSDFS